MGEIHDDIWLEKTKEAVDWWSGLSGKEKNDLLDEVEGYENEIHFDVVEELYKKYGKEKEKKESEKTKEAVDWWFGLSDKEKNNLLDEVEGYENEIHFDVVEELYNKYGKEK